MRLYQQVVKLILISAITLLFAISPLLITISQVRAQDFSANVEPLGGVVQHQSAGGAWTTITEVTLLKAGDRLRTADVGAAEINTSTNITIRIYPNTLVELDGLALGTDDGSVKLRLKQLVGLSHVVVDRTLQPGDLVQIAMPAAAASVRGTRFYTGVGSDGESFVIGEEDTVQVRSGKGDILENGPNHMSYFTLSERGEDPPATCSPTFLTGLPGTLLDDLDSEEAKQILRRFLADYLTSNANNRTAEFVGRLAGAPDQSITELIDTVLSMNVSITLPDLLSNLRAFLGSYFDAHANTPLAPETCGNGRADEGEDEVSCKLDLVDVSASCGNDLCEADAGESHINCTTDCLYGGANACAEQQGEPVVSTGGGGSGGGGGGQPSATATLAPPNPSGVGGTNP